MVKKNIKRDIFDQLLGEVNQTEVTILIGPRQVGKSSLLLKLQENVKEKTSFYDLEDPLTLAGFNLSPEEIITKLDKEDTKVIFIDEFHYLKNASKIFKAIYDRGICDPKKRVKIFASGSSTTEIHKHLKESLAGRKNTIRIFPLSFLEFTQTKQSFDEYLLFGSLPGIIHKESHKDKLALLNNILKTYIEKDIKSLVREENISPFNNLLRIVAQSQGQLVEHSSIANEIRVSSPTVQRYFDLLEETFVVNPLYSFSRNKTNELKKSKKYYFFDLGIRNLLVEDFSFIEKREDKGLLYESYVFNYLSSKLLPNMSLGFWRTKQKDEIDFVLSKNKIPYPIEVKSKLIRPSIPASFLKFSKLYPEMKDAFIINENLNLSIEMEGFSVHFLLISQLETFTLLDDILDSVL